MEKLCLRNQVCFKFYALSRYITALYQPLLAALKLTYPQYLVMLVLWETQPISVKDLGHQLMLDSGTLTPLLKRLEQKGLLSRKRSTEDERKVEVSLTEKGILIKQTASCIPDQLNQAMAIDANDFQQFNTILTKLMKQIPD
ncbi:MarR family transcriptional regulator [Rhodocytophaga rosea]|uniref:HTH-type transcriptional regulator SarZ n=1 Tax=Rhodocytophaga rosea TaxID=2704465 RepID=A0A6C0GHV9_9BACT|nr:MarR family transcriptional regulator [Rhodocytophaga rosea]QHT67651.1 MarR family transcriptional regulator [Rhodocytophaga rosea]